MRLLLVLLFVCGSAFAQPYPSKPVRWIVPTGPGSAVDVNARRITPKLSEALGQPVIVENRPGANSMIAAREAARSPADGYTLFQAVVNNAINDALAPDACCVLNDKLVPVTRLYTTPLVMVVHPSLPGTMKEYVELAKSKPNTLTYASGGTGAITQMVGELLKLTATIQVREIPYKAIGAELPDLTGGHVSTAFLSPVVIRDMVRSGKLRGVAVAAKERLAILPDVPTMAEAGYPDLTVEVAYFFLAPAGTPKPIVEKLSGAITAALHDQKVWAALAAQGVEKKEGGPEQTRAYLAAELRKWDAIVKQSAAGK